MCELILASKSPRRRELMKLLGFPFRCITPQVEEDIVEGEKPDQHVIRLSERKAFNVGENFDHGIIIGSDTIVVLDNEILEKPRSADEALYMIMKLQGHTHHVFTGFALYDSKTKKTFSSYETTEVTMREISLDIAKKYVETDEPLDKAGSYGIQGYGAVLIKSVNGCYFNVMGLPLSSLMEALFTFSDGRFDYFGKTMESLQ
ncbi:MAG TPA: septum formation protein Maf [bacterium]|nr:septum formation protein Maf [bacterium]